MPRQFLRAVLCGCLLLMAAVPVVAQRYGRRRDEAQEIFRLTNRNRIVRGLAPLRWDAGLQRSAESHLRILVQEPVLRHQYPGEPALPERVRSEGVYFSKVAENLAEGFTPETVVNGWMHSPEHRRNLLDPQLNAVGIAVDGHRGHLYVVEDFAHALTVHGPVQVERRVDELLRRQGIDPDGPRAPAEAACRSQSGVPGGPHVRLVIRFQTSNLNHLPEQVLEALNRGHYRRAAVGACAPVDAQAGFTTYRVAILLY